MRKIRRGNAALFLLWALLALILTLCRFSRGFAGLWRAGVSLPAMWALHRLTAPIPFPILEPLAVAIAAVAVFWLIAAAIRCLSLKSGGPLGRWLRGMLWAGLILGGGCALLWLPVARALPAEAINPPDAGQLEWLCGRLIETLNESPLEFPSADVAARQAPAVAGMQKCAVKAARYPEWMRLCSISGLYVPLTGEALIDASAPAPLAPFTAVHELMHLSGIADEGEANIAAWRLCLAEGGAFADSARLWALRYAMGMLRAADADAWRDAYTKMEGALLDVFRSANGEAIPGISPLAAALRLPREPGSYTALVNYLAEEALS